MGEKDEALLSPHDAMLIGHLIVEMADRAKAMSAIVPGAVARSQFEMEGIKYDISVAVARDG